MQSKAKEKGDMRHTSEGHWSQQEFLFSNHSDHANPREHPELGED